MRRMTIVMVVTVALVAAVFVSCKYFRGQILDGPGMERDSADYSVKVDSDSIVRQDITVDERTKEKIVGIIHDLYVAASQNQSDIDSRFACRAWCDMVAAVNKKDNDVAEIGFFNDDYWTMMQDDNPNDLEARDIQFEQLDEFKPQSDEDEELKQLQSALSHAEDIKVALSGVDALLNGDDSDGVGAIEALRRSSQALQQIANVYPAIEDYLSRLESVVIEVKDIVGDINGLAEDVEYNPARLQEVTERLDTLYSLEQKHHVDSSDELIALAEDIRSQLSLLADSEENIDELRKQISMHTEQAKKLAERLSGGRKKAAKQVEKLVAEALVAMDMPAAKFNADVVKAEELLPSGMDNVSFLFSANKSMSARPLADIASGGEMSRVMLALKALTSKQMHLPTIIFDEIDTGVSGKVASSMAQIMAQMSSEAGQQVLAITHLPQIAANGNAHYFVYKEDEGGRTLTHIKQLDHEGRITELAHMLSGTTVTEAAKENARQLLQGK